MTVSLLVPYRPDGGHRDAVLDWLRRRWATLLGDWEVVVGLHTDGPWCKARALTDAVTRSTGSTLVIIDADLLVGTDALTWAAQQAPHAPWIVPHSHVRRYTAQTTANVLEGHTAGEPFDPPDGDLEVPQQTVCEGGGLVVLTRDAYNRAGGMDPRFTGWGFEDSSWGYQLEAMLGPHVQGDAMAWHLWHPPARTDRPRKIDGVGGELRKRYQQARTDRDAMLDLIGERPCATAT